MGVGKRSALVVGLGIAAWLWLSLAPPRFWLNWTKRVDPTPEVGARLVDHYGCRSCHRIDRRGALKAPNLARITEKVGDPAHVALRLWLRDPRAMKPGTNMPNFHLSDYEIDAILAYLEEVDRRLAARGDRS